VRLSWLPGSAQHGYQIQIYQNELWCPAPETPYWDTGQVGSWCSVDIPYDGPGLAPGGRYAWRVRVWDSGGTVSGWSDPATFEVELDQAVGWDAWWIGLDRARESSASTRSRVPPACRSPPPQC
jgi:alpha-L-rhamnosidase